MENARCRKPLCSRLETTRPGVPVSSVTSLKRVSPVAEHTFATIRFSFEFSCSSSFSRFAWSTCKPPYSRRQR
jgi:hypothetical protein